MKNQQFTQVTLLIFFFEIETDFLKKSPALADNITHMIYVKTMSQRKQQIESNADSFVIFIGGLGSMDKLFEIIELLDRQDHYESTNDLFWLQNFRK